MASTSETQRNANLGLLSAIMREIRYFDLDQTQQLTQQAIKL
jgi:hypothetical protein